MKACWEELSDNIHMEQVGRLLNKDCYLTVSGDAGHEIIINKSRFIGYAAPVSSEVSAQNVIDQIKRTHADATHNCYGYIIGTDGNIKRFSDDGEPGGTAGMPIIQVIEQKNLVNTIVVVTRYFGGIKLGAGGLVRAYSKTAAETIARARIAKMEYSTSGNIIIGYNQIGMVEHYLKANGIPVKNVEYGSDVVMTVIVKGAWDDFSRRIIERFNGNISARKLDDLYYCWE